MRKSLLLLGLFWLFGAVPWARAQEAPKPLPPAPTPTSDPEALAILAKAIDQQGPQEYAEEGAIRDLTVRIQGEVWDYSKEPAEKLSLGVNRYLTMDPERFRSEWKTTAGTDVYGYDGRFYWMAEYNSSGSLLDHENNPRFLRGDPYATDRQRIQDEIGETRYLLRFFFLANLRGPRVVFRTKADATIEHYGQSRTCHVLTRDNLDPESTEPPLTLWFDSGNSRLLSAKAHATDYGQKSLHFSFRYDERVQPRVKGVLFPFKIETREQPYGAEAERLANRATVVENGIAFNSGLEKAIFLRPKKAR